MIYLAHITRYDQEMSDMPNLDHIQRTAQAIKSERMRLGWSTGELAKRARQLAGKSGYDIALSQQTISAFEQGNAKRIPSWAKYVIDALGNNMIDPDRSVSGDGVDGRSVLIEKLPTYAGAGGGGTGEGDINLTPFSRDLVEYELRAKASDLVAVEIEGNSMSPDFQSGDQLLIDKRKITLAQPGAFCLWDGDGYVVKYIEKVPGSDPQKIRVISRNEIYSTSERLAEEVSILGRVVWFARRV